MIWEYTWPTARLIEGAICEDETAEEYEDVAFLRVLGPLSTMLDRDLQFEGRVVEEGPVEARSAPVALHVCQESRKHTSKHYQFLTHNATAEGSFYFNPRRDVVWFSFNFTDESQYIRDIKHCYGKQLNSVETVLVQESVWEDWKPAGFTAKFLRQFVSLKTILHLMDDRTMMLIGPRKSGMSPKGPLAEFVALVNKIKAEYRTHSSKLGERAKGFRCIDRNLKVY